MLGATDCTAQRGTRFFTRFSPAAPSDGGEPSHTLAVTAHPFGLHQPRPGRTASFGSS